MNGVVFQTSVATTAAMARLASASQATGSAMIPRPRRAALMTP